MTGRGMLDVTKEILDVTKQIQLDPSLKPC